MTTILKHCEDLKRVGGKVAELPANIKDYSCVLNVYRLISLKMFCVDYFYLM